MYFGPRSLSKFCDEGGILPPLSFISISFLQLRRYAKAAITMHATNADCSTNSRRQESGNLIFDRSSRFCFYGTSWNSEIFWNVSPVPLALWIKVPPKSPKTLFQVMEAERLSPLSSVSHDLCFTIKFLYGPRVSERCRKLFESYRQGHRRQAKNNNEDLGAKFGQRRKERKQHGRWKCGEVRVIKF